MSEQWKIWCFPTNSAIALFETNFFLNTPMLVTGGRSETVNRRDPPIQLFYGAKLEITESTVTKLAFKDALLDGMGQIYELINDHQLTDMVIRSIKLRTRNFEILFKSNTLKDYATDDQYIRLTKSWEANKRAYKRGIKISSLDAVNITHLTRNITSNDTNRLKDRYGGFIRTVILTSTSQMRSISIE